MNKLFSILAVLLAIFAIQVLGDDLKKLAEDKSLADLSDEQIEKISKDNDACGVLIAKATAEGMEKKKAAVQKHVCKSPAMEAYKKKEAKDRPNSEAWEKACKEENKDVKPATKKGGEPNAEKKEEPGFFARYWMWIALGAVGLLIAAGAVYFFVIRD